MAILRDTKFIQTLADSLGIESVSIQACQRILNEVERKLRTIIFRGNKYRKSGFRDQMKSEDILSAMKDLRLSEILGYSSEQELKFLQAMDVWIPQTNVKENFIVGIGP